MGEINRVLILSQMGIKIITINNKITRLVLIFLIFNTNQII